MNKVHRQWLIVTSFGSLVLLLAFASMPRSHAQECITVVSNNVGKDNRFLKLEVSNEENCVPIYGFYVQAERNGTVQQVTSTPSGWGYGLSENTAFWTTDDKPLVSETKVFGIEFNAQKPYTFRWIALDNTMSPIADGILTAQG